MRLRISSSLHKAWRSDDFVQLGKRFWLAMNWVDISWLKCHISCFELRIKIMWLLVLSGSLFRSLYKVRHLEFQWLMDPFCPAPQLNRWLLETRVCMKNRKTAEAHVILTVFYRNSLGIFETHRTISFFFFFFFNLYVFLKPPLAHESPMRSPSVKLLQTRHCCLTY